MLLLGYGGFALTQGVIYTQSSEITVPKFAGRNFPRAIRRTHY